MKKSKGQMKLNFIKISPTTLPGDLVLLRATSQEKNKMQPMKQKRFTFVNSTIIKKRFVTYLSNTMVNFST